MSGSSSAATLKHERRKVGSVEIPEAGEYTIETSSNDAAAESEILLDA